MKKYNIILLSVLKQLQSTTYNILTEIKKIKTTKQSKFIFLSIVYTLFLVNCSVSKKEECLLKFDWITEGICLPESVIRLKVTNISTNDVLIKNANLFFQNIVVNNNNKIVYPNYIHDPVCRIIQRKFILHPNDTMVVNYNLLILSMYELKNNIEYKINFGISINHKIYYPSPFIWSKC